MLHSDKLFYPPRLLQLNLCTIWDFFLYLHYLDYTYSSLHNCHQRSWCARRTTKKTWESISIKISWVHSNAGKANIYEKITAEIFMRFSDCIKCVCGLKQIPNVQKTICWRCIITHSTRHQTSDVKINGKR